MTPEDHARLARRELDRLHPALDAAASTPVPSCPGWSGADLTAHLRDVVRMMTAAVHAADPSAPPAAAEPHTADGATDMLRAETTALLDLLEATDADAPCWTLTDDGRTGYWRRRLLHELTIHRTDVEVAVGATPAIDPPVAADGVHEWVATYFLRRRLWRKLPPGSFHFHLTDVDDAAELTVTHDEEGAVVEPIHAKADLALKGPAAGVVLALYGRADPTGRTQRFGDDDRWTAFGMLTT